jgi:hypothetical protein
MRESGSLRFDLDLIKHEECLNGARFALGAGEA